MLSSGHDTSEEFQWIRDDENRALMIERFKAAILLGNEIFEEPIKELRRMITLYKANTGTR